MDKALDKYRALRVRQGYSTMARKPIRILIGLLALAIEGGLIWFWFFYRSAYRGPARAASRTSPGAEICGPAEQAKIA